MTPFQKLSTLAKQILAWEKQAIDANNMPLAHTYAMSWFDVAELMAKDIRRGGK